MLELDGRTEPLTGGAGNLLACVALISFEGFQ